MRIIAGTYRSRILKSLKGSALRPTSDRLRETLFNVLGTAVQGSRFLDLFAAALIRRNLESLGIRPGVKVLAENALSGLERLAAKHRTGDAGFDFVFVDPPYAAEQEYHRVLALLGSASILAAGATVIAEHRRTFELPAQVGGLRRTRILRQGDAALTFYQLDRTKHDPE